MYVSERLREINILALRLLFCAACLCFLLLPSFVLAQNVSTEETSDNNQLQATHDLSPAALAQSAQSPAGSEQTATTIAVRHVPRPRIQILRLHEPGTAAPVAPFAIAGAHADYFGGPVITNVHIVQVLYGTGAYLPNVAGTATPTLGQFYTDLTQSSYFDMLSEYSTAGVVAEDGTAGTNQVIGHGFFDGLFNITPSAANNGPTITDAQIQSELLAQVAAGHLPAPVFDAQANDNTLYMIFFPPGKTITAGGTTSCVRGGFCAYHNSTTGTFASHRLFYGVHPDLQPPSGCSQGCGTSLNVFDNVTTVTSHELSEAVTDADVGPANTLGRPLAWIDPVNSEIGDICVGQAASVVANNTTYIVQQEFSDLQNDCVQAPPVFSFNPMGNTQPGVPFELKLSVQNGFGTNLLSYTGSVHFSSSDPAAVLPSDYTYTIPDQGSHTFIATLNTQGAQTITATDTQLPGYHGSLSSSVSPLKVDHFEVIGPVNSVKGTASSFFVKARDPSNNFVAGFTGNIHVTSSDSAALVPADGPLAGGQGTISVTFNTAGPQNILVADAANPSATGFAPSTVLASGPNATVTTLTSSLNPSRADQAVTYTATVSGATPTPTGIVTFTGENIFSPVAVDASGHAELVATVGGGVHAIYANYSGDATHDPSTATPIIESVTPAPDSMVLSTSATSASFGIPVTISANLSSPAFPGGFGGGGFVTFTDNGNTVAIRGSVSNPIESFTTASMSVGTHTIAASFSGSDEFLPATATPIVVTITPGSAPDYSITSGTSAATISAGQTVSFLITATSLNGFSGNVNFSCGNLPPLTTCTFDPPIAFVSPAVSNLTVSLSVKTTGHLAGLVSPPRGRTADALLWAFTPFAAGLVVLSGGYRRRMRSARVALMLLPMVLVLGLSSCGGGSTPPPLPPAPSATPAGTTNFTVTATGTGTSGTKPATPTQQLSIALTVQ